MNTTIINEFPQETQDEIKETLKVWRGVHVTRNNGAFTTSIGVGITASYEPRGNDWKSWKIMSDDIYTEEERAAHAKVAPDLN